MPSGLQGIVKRVHPSERSKDIVDMLYHMLPGMGKRGYRPDFEPGALRMPWSLPPPPPSCPIRISCPQRLQEEKRRPPPHGQEGGRGGKNGLTDAPPFYL